MATIYNSEHIKKIINELKLAPSREKMPTELADKILPVYNINNPFQIKSKSNTNSNSTSATIHTTSTTADTYLISCDLSMIKDVTATSLRSALAAFPFEDNAVSDILVITGLTLVAQNGQVSKSFPIPFKLARGTNITLVNSTNVANVRCAGTIQFFEVPD